MPTARTKSKALPRADFPEQVGVSSKAISELLDDFERSGIELHSIMILRHGKVAFETWRDPYAPDIPHTMYSVSKSFASIATGFAIDEGLLTLDTKVIAIFPEYRPQKYDANLEKMTVFHLLTMTAGKDVSVLENKAKVSWLKSFFGARWAFAPGEGWKYISENCYVLCAIIQKLTGMTVREYLAPRLFKPLGIRENPAWETDPNGLEAGGWGLFITTEELAKVIDCMSHSGKYQGKQVIPEFWAREAGKAQADNSSKSSNPASDTASTSGAATSPALTAQTECSRSSASSCRNTTQISSPPAARSLSKRRATACGDTSPRASSNRRMSRSRPPCP